MPSKLGTLLKRQRNNTQQLTQAVAETRARIADLTQEAKTVRAAPVPLETAIARMNAAVDAAQADDATLGGMGRFLTPDGNGALDNETTQAAYARRPLAFVAAVAPAAVREELHSKLVASYERMVATPYSDADRKRRLQEIEHEVAQLQRDEEIAIRTAEASDMSIERRADASPSVVLSPDRELGMPATSDAA